MKITIKIQLILLLITSILIAVCRLTLEKPAAYWIGGGIVVIFMCMIYIYMDIFNCKFNAGWTRISSVFRRSSTSELKMSAILELALAEIEKKNWPQFGICGTINLLLLDINSESKGKAVRFIHLNRPRQKSPFYDKEYKNAIYYWKPGIREPRIAWLKHLIKELKEKGE